MAERQSAVVAFSLPHLLKVKKLQLSLFALLLGAVFWLTPPVARADTSVHQMLAMGDIGAIRTNITEGSDASQQLTWAQLSEDQKKVLAPLGAEWDTLRPWQREKMLDIARDYPKMDAKKQERVKKRLNSWSRMTPYERENARQRYQQFYNLSPEKKDELRKKWAEHQKSRKESGEAEYDPEFE
jgi:hypothetical protein